VRGVGVAGVDDLEAMAFELEVVAVKGLGEHRRRDLPGEELLPEPLAPLRGVVDRRVGGRLRGANGERVRERVEELPDPEEVITVTVCDVSTETTTESREHWARANERLAELDPVAVVAGHKKPELPDDPATIAETAAYLRDFNHVEAETSTALELCDQMLELYPRRANPGSLWGGAKVAKSL
jgi:hypothetical protein